MWLSMFRKERMWQVQLIAIAWKSLTHLQAKNEKIIILFALCFGIFTSCIKNDSMDLGINQVILKTQAEIEKTYNAKISAVGLGAAHGVYSMTINFSIEKSLTVDEARRVMGDCASLFLKNINSNTTLRPYLVEYPFPPSMISMAFWITDGTYEPIRTPGILKSITLNNGIIKYNTVSKKGIVQVGDQAVIMHQETFDEAKRIVENEKTS